MAQSGLHLPASSGTSITRFSKSLAEYRDEQSIEQSLSTFLFHMRNIVDIFREADADTLGPLDELGAGTDPTEGPLWRFPFWMNYMGEGAKPLRQLTIRNLKNMPSLPRRSERFHGIDVETLSPTYRLTVALPGDQMHLRFRRN